MKSIQKVKGFSDLYPPQSTKYRFMEETGRQVFSRYGFLEMRIPVLERTELFARSIGDETDVVQKEMYTFPDRKGRSLTLRPEATAGVIRAFIENKLYGQDQVSKYFTFGPMFRYERPQKGRMRQFHQINVEVLGPSQPTADAEVIIMLVQYLKAVGVKDMTLELNSLGCRENRRNYFDVLKDYFTTLDPESMCEDCRRRVTANPLRVLDCKVPGCRENIKNAPRITDYLCRDCEDHFIAVQNLLESAGVEYVLNPRLVRGLDYYQRTTFEVVSGDIGAQSSIAGGGRYDGLIQDLGGPEIPGVGFAVGMERLAMLVPETKEPAMHFYMAPLDESTLNMAFILAQELRSRGFAGEVGFTAKSPKAQLRQANKMGVRYCLLLGPDELRDATVVVKNMDTGEQFTLGQWELADVFAKTAG